MKIIISVLLVAALIGCATGGPRAPNAPPRVCGLGSGEWTLARLYPHMTRVLERATWDDWLLGNKVMFPGKQKGVKIQRNVRINPWAGGAQGAYLYIDGDEYDLDLLSADPTGCYYIGFDTSLVLFSYRGNLELVYLLVGPEKWIVINPRGGSTL